MDFNRIIGDKVHKDWIIGYSLFQFMEGMDLFRLQTKGFSFFRRLVKGIVVSAKCSRYLW